MYFALKQGQMGQAQRFAAIIMKLTVALFGETDPAPVKYALSLLNVMSPRVRLPLVEPNNGTKTDITSVLASVCERHSDSVIGKLSAAELGGHQSIRAAAN